jgi:hypothetical protein
VRLHAVPKSLDRRSGRSHEAAPEPVTGMCAPGQPLLPPWSPPPGRIKKALVPNKRHSLRSLVQANSMCSPHQTLSPNEGNSVWGLHIESSCLMSCWA